MNKLKGIALCIIICSAFILGVKVSIDYVLDNQYIESIDCTHGDANFDYGIYLQDKLVKIYE